MANILISPLVKNIADECLQPSCYSRAPTEFTFVAFRSRGHDICILIYLMDVTI
jgi:hypothetical protein